MASGLSGWPLSLAVASLWAPQSIGRYVRENQSTVRVRLVWVVLGATAGVAIGTAHAEMTSQPLGWQFIAGGALLALIASSCLHESASTLGLMGLSALALMIPINATIDATHREMQIEHNWITLPLFVLALPAGLALAGSGGNVGFALWPAGLAVYALSTASPKLSSDASQAAAMLGGLLLFLFAFRLAYPQACIQALYLETNTDDYSAKSIANFRRWLTAVYVAFAACLLAVSFSLTEPSAMRVMASIFLAAALLELEIYLWIPLSLWLVLRVRTTAHRTYRPVVANPSMPLPPIGIGRFWRSVRAQLKPEDAYSFAVDAILRTAYHGSPRKMMQRLAPSHPRLHEQALQRLRRSLPDHQGSDTNPPRITVPAAPAVHVGQAPVSRLKNDHLFVHYYQEPRGRQSTPLQDIGIGIPAIPPPEEVMTLWQIVQRSLGSVHEPFRRSRIVAPESVRADLYLQLVRLSATWADQSLGAGLIPIALSVRKLADRGAELRALTLQALEARRGAGSATQAQLPQCQRLLEWGWNASSPADDQTILELSKAMVFGNAYILLDGARLSREESRSLRRLLDAVFGDGGISHIAILEVAGAGDRKVLSDSQRFVLESTEPSRSNVDDIPGAFIAGLCRLAERASRQPPDPVGIVVLSGAVLSVAGFVAFNYGAMVGFVGDFNTPGSWAKSPGHVAAFIILGYAMAGLALVLRIVGFVRGSDQLRSDADTVLVTSLLGYFSLCLVRLPAAVTPGMGRTALVLVSLLPSAIFIGISVLRFIAMTITLVWLTMSVRIASHLTAEGLRRAQARHRIGLHIARRSFAISLSYLSADAGRLPLLVSAKGGRILSVALESEPNLIPVYKRIVLDGIRTGATNTNFSTAALILDALSNRRTAATERCLALIAAECSLAHGKGGAFATYRQPGSVFSMDALEYVNRRLSYLTNIDELIVVR